MLVPIEIDPIHTSNPNPRYPLSNSHSHFLQKSGSTDQGKKSSTGLDAVLVGTGSTRESRGSWGSRAGRARARAGTSSRRLAGLGSRGVRLCSGYASNGSHGAGSSGAQGLSSIAVRGDGVLDWGLVERVGAVVVADEDVTVDVAQADEVVALLVAGVDARLVAGNTRVNDVLSIALVLGSDEADGRGERNGNGGGETHLDGIRLERKVTGSGGTGKQRRLG